MSKKQRCKECNALLIEVNGKLVCVNPSMNEHPIVAKRLVEDYEKWREEQDFNGT